jgi:hypothetical protein
MYRSTKFRLDGFSMLRAFLNTATMAECAHLHLRKVSLVQWKNVLNQCHPQRWVDAEQGSFIISTLADLPSLRELELGERFLPTGKQDYESEEWFNIMETLHSNKGHLRIVAVTTQSGWWMDWARVGGRNFGWAEQVLLKTFVDIKTWNELVDLDIGNFNFDDVFSVAMSENWARGPLKHASVEIEGREYKVRFWGVPECVRRSEERRVMRREAKVAYVGQQSKEMARKSKGLTRSPRIDSAMDEDEEESESVGDVEMRSRKTLTREEARTKRMERQRNHR